MCPLQQHFTRLVLGLTVGLTSSLTASANDVRVQQFGDWKVTIQPGNRTEDVLIPPSPAPAQANLIRLVSQVNQLPVLSLGQNEEALFPVEPPKPENPDTAVESTDVNPAANTNETAPGPQSSVETPATPSPTITPCPTCRSVDPLALVALYPQVYNAIPFIRSEYEANPSYRHDATMEFLFGQMRQTVIQRSRTTVNQNSGGGAYPMNPVYSPYGFNSYYYPFYTPYYYQYNNRPVAPLW